MPGNIIDLTPEDIANWPKPNYVDPERRAWAAEYACILCILATLTLFTRFWLRYKKFSGGLGLDDALLFVGWMGMVWFTVLFVLGTEKYMIDRHMWDLPLERIVGMVKNTWIAEVAFVLTGCCIRVSVLLFYRRLVEHTYSRYWLWALYFAIGFTVAYTLGLVVMLAFNCSPTEAYWKAFDLTYQKEYTCRNTKSVNLLAGIFAAISDAYSVALPCIMTMGLRMPKRQKIALSVVFSLGLVIVAISGVRTYWLWQVGVTTDVTTCIFYVFVYSHLEVCLGIICAALPSLRVLAREYLGHNSRLGRRVSRLKKSAIALSACSSDARPAHDDDSHAERGPARRLHSPTPVTLTSLDSSKQMSSTSDRSEEQARLEANGGGDAWGHTRPFAVPPPVKTPDEYETWNQRTIDHFRRTSHFDPSGI